MSELENSTDLIQPISQEGQPAFSAEPYYTAPAEEPAAPPRKKKTGLLIALAIIALLALTAVTFFLVFKDAFSISFNLPFKASSPEKNVIIARIEDDGDAFVPLMNGEFVKIKGDVKQATITADRKNIVVLLNDGSLYVTDKEQAEKTSVADDAIRFSYVRDTGFFYVTEDNLYFRYTFESDESVKLGENLAYSVARDTLSVIYADVDGNIFKMPYDSSDEEKIGTFEYRVSVDVISNDGEVTVWTNSDDSKQTVFLNEGDETLTLGDVDRKSFSTYVTFSKDQNLVVVLNTYGEELWIKQRSQDIVKVKLPAEPYSSTVYTEDGYLRDMNSDKVSSVFILTEADSSHLKNVYNISLDGDKERVLSKVLDAQIAKNTIVYADEDGNLYYAKLKGTEISDEQKIAGDVCAFETSNSGKYIYYGKNYDDDAETMSLYCFKVGKSEPVKVSSDVDGYVYSSGNWGDIYISQNYEGDAVVYVKNPEYIGSSYRMMGTLYTWSYGDDNPTKISDDAIRGSETSGLYNRFDAGSFTFVKYEQVDSDDKIHCTWYYFNGKEAEKFASDIIY